MSRPPSAPETGTSVAAPTPEPPLGAWQGFWHSLRFFDAGKMSPHLAFRNTLGVLLALSLGAMTGHLLTGSVVATGALNVSYSDDSGPYRRRGRRMLTSSLIGAFAALVGSVTGEVHVLAVCIAAGWAFIVGLLVAISTTAADLGTISLVVLLVFSAKPMSPEDALDSSALLLAGGLLQTGLALALWPVRRYLPERRSLSQLYGDLAATAHEPASSQAPPPATVNATLVQQALEGLARDRTHDGERFRALLDEGERIRLSVLSLQRMTKRLQREHAEDEARRIEDVLKEVEQVLAGVSALLLADNPDQKMLECARNIQRDADRWRQHHQEDPASLALTLAREAWHQVDALAGQLRAAILLTTDATPEGEEVAVEREERRPWRVRWRGTLATLRANLTLRSATCRHALRLATCVALGDTLGRSWGLQRSYWMPMTIAIVLKPDFTATISRGILRLTGTITGLLLATLLFHVVPITPGVELALLAGLMFIMRWVGPAHYGVFTTSLSALIVVLFSLTGVAPQEVIAQRGLNTMVGGLLALGAYFAWPTWERTQIGDVLAQMLDAYRAYFRAVGDAYGVGQLPGSTLDAVRINARLTRTNSEASAGRLTAEPRISLSDVEAIRGILAHSNRFIHAVMSLEAGLWRGVTVSAHSDLWRAFVRDVDLTLYFLADLLRRPDYPQHPLPDLRADQRALEAPGPANSEETTLIHLESDRLTDSLNSLREQIIRWAAQKA